MKGLAMTRQGRVVVITTLISACSAVAVAIIGNSSRASDYRGESTPSLRIAGRVATSKAASPASAIAQVYLVEGNRTAATDAEGKFLFDRVPQGFYHLLVETTAPEGKVTRRYLIDPEAVREDKQLVSWEICKNGDQNCK